VSASPQERLDALAELTGDDDEGTDALALIESLRQGGTRLDALVARYGDTVNPGVARALAFLLARAAVDPDSAPSAAQPVWSLLERLATDDDWARVNLLSALQGLAMHGQLSASDGRCRVVPVLLDWLERAPAVQAAAIPLVAQLRALGALTQLPERDRRRLAERLAAARDGGDDLVRAELDELERRPGGL
jgi:hypothetical protein